MSVKNITPWYKDLELYQGLILLLLIICIVLVCFVFTTEIANISYIAGNVQGAHAVYVEAVELGHAEWVVDSEGNTYFQWLNSEKLEVIENEP